MKSSRSVLLLLFIACIINTASAGNAKDAITVAEKFFIEKLGIKPSDGLLVAANASEEDSTIKLNSSEKSSDYYAYNANGCFVVMVAGGNDMHVAGYGTNGHFSFEGMPEALAIWLADYKKTMDAGLYDAQEGKQIFEPVSPMITTKWGQGEPYNNLCPKYQGRNLYTGCMATAMAQILNYYQSEAPGYDKIEYVDNYTKAEISVDFTKINYDWDNMLDAYGTGEYTEEQANAVARLMADAGAALKSEYGYSETSASMAYVAFDRYYNYNCEFWVREWVPTDIWIETVRNELKAGRPVLYGGSSGFKAHAFVIDGMDADGNVHINWGWNGTDDGYYDINFCNPPTEEDGGYYSKHQMLVGLRPRTADEQYEEKYVIAGYVYKTGDVNWTWTEASGVTTNFYDSRKIYYTSCLTQNGEIKWIKESENYNELQTAFPVYYDIHVFGSGQVEAEDGIYDMNVLYKFADTEDDEWRLMEINDFATTKCVVENGEATSIYPFDESKNYSLVNVEPACELYGKAPMYLNITARNNSEGVSLGGMSFEVSFVSKEDGTVYGPERLGFKTRYDNVDDCELFELTPTNESNGFRMPAGEYTVVCDDPNVTMEDEFTVTLRDVDYPVFGYWRADLLYIKNTWEWNDYLSGIALNREWIEADNKVEGTTTFALYLIDSATGEETLLQAIPDVEIPCAGPLVGVLPGNLYPLEGVYKVEMRYHIPGEGEVVPYSPDYANADLDEIYILGSTETSFPQISTTSDLLENVDYLPTGEAQNIIVPLHNDDNVEFSGSLTAYFYNAEAGDAFSVEVTDVTIPANADASVTIPVTFSEKGVYVMSMRVLHSYSSNNVQNMTFVNNGVNKKASYRVGVGVSGVNSIEKKSSIKVYPNPADDIIIVKGAKENSIVTVYSTLGMMMTRTEIGESSVIDVSDYPAGIYIMNVDGETIKFVKK